MSRVCLQRSINNELLCSPKISFIKDMTVVSFGSDLSLNRQKSSSRSAPAAHSSTAPALLMCLGSMFSMLPDLQFGRFLIWARNSSLLMNQVLGICISHSHMGNVIYELTNITQIAICYARPPLPSSSTAACSPPCHPALHLPSRRHTCYSSRMTPMAI
jgi:hypothetical protein